MNKALSSLLYKADLSRHVSHHLVGKHHTPKHRKVTGLGIMVFGVMLAKVAAHFDHLSIHIIGDLFGYALHGIGLIPYVSDIEHNVESTTNINKQINTKPQNNEL